MLAWVAGLATPFAVRLALVAAFRTRPEAWAATRWRTAFRTTFAGHGLAWAVAGAVLFVRPHDATRQALLAFAVGGIAISALTSAPFDLVASGVFVTLASVPLGVRLLTSDASGEAVTSCR